MNVVIGLIFSASGLAALVFARSLGALVIRQIEWQLRLIRRPWFVWYYRVFGAIFLVGGLSLFLSHPE